MTGRIVLASLVVAIACPSARAGSAADTAGDVLQIVLPVTAAGMSLGLRDFEGTIDFAKSFSLTVSSTWILKVAIDSERPGGGGQAMPSGHTSAAFSGASFIQRRYGWKVGVPAYAAATFVAWSRVHGDHHHVEDVVVGAAIGIASTYLFARPFDRGVVITPRVGVRSYGVEVALRW